MRSRSHSNEPVKVQVRYYLMTVKTEGSVMDADTAEHVIGNKLSEHNAVIKPVPEHLAKPLLDQPPDKKK